MSKNMSVVKNNTNSLVSIIIPFRDGAGLLRQCVESVLRKTENAQYEIILVNNQSSERGTVNLLKEFAQKYSETVRVIDYDFPFNFSAINNFAVKGAMGEFLVFLNNDTEVIASNWLVQMKILFDDESVGVVGAKLLYADNTIQHAGIEIVRNDLAHAFAHLDNNDVQGVPFNSLRECPAVTAACMMTRKKLFDELGEFDEQNLATAYNDVDYCFRVRAAGHKVMYQPQAVLHHYESVSRGKDIFKRWTHPERYRKFLAERSYLRKKWAREYFGGAEDGVPAKIDGLLVRLWRKYL